MSLLSHESRFSKAPVNNISRSVFDRSHTLVTTFSAGKLIPCYLDEVLPGDTCTLDMSLLARMATPLYPVMDNAWIDVHFFFVPNRLVWDHWKNFMGESSDPWDSDIEYSVPVCYCTPMSDSLSGYLGLPIGFDRGNPAWCSANALPFRAYQLVWNEWFRDQNLQDPVYIDTGDDGNAGDILELRPVNKYHDYFTSCLPAPQKGADVTLTVSNSAGGLSPVVGGPELHSLGSYGAYFGLPNNSALLSGTTHPLTFTVENVGSSLTDGFVGVGPLTDASTLRGVSHTNLYADLAGTVSTTTINQLRQAFAVQRLLERDARGGTRYRELIKAHFGVDNGDLRMQVPEYLGGKHIPINITQVVQQSSTDSEPSPLGEVGAMSKTVDSGSVFTKSFTEHGYILGLVSVRTDHTYWQGIPRLFNRRSRFDFYWPELANIGEQAVYAKEIYGTAPDGEVFGYQEAWADYRYKPNQITGKAAIDATAATEHDPRGLAPWTYADMYSGIPRLSDGWIQETDSNVARTLAVSNTQLYDQFIANFYFKARWARPMPVYSIPGLTGHI